MELRKVESKVNSFLLKQVKLTDYQKRNRANRMLNLITSLYNKHKINVSPEDAYNLLFKGNK